MAEEKVYFKIEEGAIAPMRATSGAAGFDLYALEETTIHYDDGNVCVPTGVSVLLPHGTYGRIAMRSGLAYRHNLSISAGVIDIDYRGQIGVIVYNTQPGARYTIAKHERFAQLVIERCSYAEGMVVEILPASDSEHTGFGSTGEH